MLTNPVNSLLLIHKHPLLLPHKGKTPLLLLHSTAAESRRAPDVLAYDPAGHKVQAEAPAAPPPTHQRRVERVLQRVGGDRDRDAGQSEQAPTGLEGGDGIKARATSLQAACISRPEVNTQILILEYVPAVVDVSQSVGLRGATPHESVTALSVSALQSA
jgi:hypothetical protein